MGQHGNLVLFCSWAIDRHRSMPQQLGDTADMVGVAVRDQDGA
jgi:hypothetical protein